MEIISLKFALLTIGSFLIFYLLNPKYRIGYLVVLSCGFIATFSFYLLIYVLGYAIINYFIGIRIPHSKFKTALFRTGIIVNLLQLILLKYSSFAIDPIVGIFKSDLIISRLSGIIMPVGISYFTLQGIGYLINVKMGWEKPENKFLNFLLYITFFPKFLGGPIERSKHFLSQLRLTHLFNEQQVSEGLRIALFGFFKKVAIANQLAPYINSNYADLSSADGLSLWVLIVIQPLYLYFDFSGYSDIAIGFAKTFGIELLPNFNKPFFSENMTTFWKRFHISLSSWFNDYIFRQASFKFRRWGIFASVFALLLTWFLFGIWHGAGWTFMMLGLVQASAIIYEFFTKNWRLKIFSGVPDHIRVWTGRTITYLFYGMSLVFFFAPDIKAVSILFKKLFIINLTSDSILSLLHKVHTEISGAVLFFIFILLAIELINNDFGKLYTKLESLWAGPRKINLIFRWSICYLVLAILYVLGRDIHQFIYFQF